MPQLAKVLLACFLLFAAAAIAPASKAKAESSKPDLRMGIPVDTSSPGVWNEVIQGAPAVGLIVFNPSSGPGSLPLLALASEVARAQAAGIKVVGYVPTEYADGNVSVASAEHEVDEFQAWYHTDGFFFDQANASCALRPSGYYAALYDYVKSKGPGLIVVLNPGVTPGACYTEMSDIIVSFENTLQAYQTGYESSDWTYQHPSNSFLHIILGAPDAESMMAAINEAESRNAGWVYVTSQDPGSGNTYGQLPTYFGEEVDFVRGLDGGGVRLGSTPLLVLVIVTAAACVAVLLVSRPSRKGSLLRGRQLRPKRRLPRS